MSHGTPALQGLPARFRAFFLLACGPLRQPTRPALERGYPPRLLPNSTIDNPMRRHGHLTPGFRAGRAWITAGIPPAVDLGSLPDDALDADQRFVLGLMREGDVAAGHAALLFVVARVGAQNTASPLPKAPA